MVGVVDAPAVEVAEKVVVGRRGPWVKKEGRRRVAWVQPRRRVGSESE